MKLETSYPTLSFLAVCRNHERYVAECLRSMLAADQPCQIVFLDNGSKDKSVAIARATLAEAPSHITTRVIALSPEEPLCKALNIGARECTGEFMKLISTDDAIGPNFFTAFRTLAATSDHEVGAWLAGSVIIDETGKVVRQDYPGEPFGAPGGPPVYLHEDQVINTRRAPPSGAPSMWCRRKVWEDIGGFDERFRFEDRPFNFNVLKRGWKIAIHPYNNTYYRVHSGAISADPAWMAEARLPIMFDFARRAEWRNKPLAAFHLARTARVVAMYRWKRRSAHT